MKTTKIMLVIFVSATVLLSCKTSPIISEGIGTAAGAVIGGLLGSRVGEGRGKTIAIALGAVTGAYLGNKIASWMNEQDQQDVARVGGDALNNADDGQTVSWENPDTGLTVTATPRNTKKLSREVQVLRLKSVDKHELDIIGESYTARKSANLRAGPAVSDNVVGGLRQGEAFEAIGRVKNAEYKGRGWIAVGKGGGRLVGYVWEPLVEVSRQTDITRQTSLTTSEDIKQENSVKVKDSVDLDALDIRAAETSGGADLDTLFEEDTITADTSCRDMDVAVEKDLKDGNSTITACKSPSGAWEII